MKTPNYLKHLKTGLFMCGLLSLGTMSAQQTAGDVAKDADISYGTTTTGGSIRVIDNKGTIKYLQSQNGITMLTNTTANVTTTTWQLGGTLTDDTVIDVAGNAFAIDGIELITATDLASTDAVSLTNAGTGYTLLVRDEATGATKKMLVTDLLQSGQDVFTATLGQTAYALNGAPVLPAFEQVWVYRNGAKLIAGLDYTVAAATVTLIPNGTAPNDWAVYADDVIEVHYVK